MQVTTIKHGLPSLFILPGNSELLSFLNPRWLLPLWLSTCPCDFLPDKGSRNLHDEQIGGKKKKVQWLWKLYRAGAPGSIMTSWHWDIMTLCLLLGDLSILSYTMQVTVSTHGRNQHLLVSCWTIWSWPFLSWFWSCLKTAPQKGAEVPHLHIFSLGFN